MKTITITLQVETDANDAVLESTVKRWLNYGLEVNSVALPNEVKKLNVFISGKDEREN